MTALVRIEARYDGWCAHCGDAWSPGDSIARSGLTDDEYDRWLHAHCAEVVHEAMAAEQ